MTTTTDAIERLCASLTLEEKVTVLTGRDFWNTVAIDRIGLGNLLCSDGPSGVRGERWDEREPSLNLPSSTALASSWSRDLATRYGDALGAEARRQGRRHRPRPDDQPAPRPVRRAPLRVHERGPAVDRRARRRLRQWLAGPRRGGVRQALRRQRLRDRPLHGRRRRRRAPAPRAVPAPVRARCRRRRDVVGDERVQQHQRRHGDGERSAGGAVADGVGVRRRGDQRLDCGPLAAQRDEGTGPRDARTGGSVGAGADRRRSCR